MPAKRQKLIPDQLFAIDYGGTFRSFVLEADRGTEPYKSAAARKSFKRTIELYADLSAEDGLRSHYGLKSPLLVLMAFTAPERAAKCLQTLELTQVSFATKVLVTVVPLGFPRFDTVRELVVGPWKRGQTKAIEVLS